MELFGMPLHDAQENVSEDGRARNTMDAINRVVQAETFDGNIQINRYDAEDLRAEMEENGRISKFVFDGKNVVAEETDEDVIRYIRGDRLVASDSEHARTYYHYVGDELGSITHVVKGDKKENFDKEESESSERGYSVDRILNHYIYDAFGNRTVCEEKIANRFGYAGEQYDGITQQYYLRARFYNPVIGRFTQEDTYYGDGLNLYEYGRNNPMRYIDPSGHEVRAAAEKNYVNRAVDAMNRAADQGVDGMLERVYGETEGSTIVKYSPIKPGPLKEEVANSFNGGTYRERILIEDTVMYRVSGGNAGEVGSYMSKTPQSGGLQSQLDLALNPAWGNTTENLTKVVVPKGTTIYEGIAAPQNIYDSLGNVIGTLPGGGNQVYIPIVEEGWFQ